MNNRYPGPVQLPVVIPRCPLLDPGGQCYVPTENSWLWTLAVVGAILLIPESAIPAVGAFAARGAGLGALPAKPRKRRGNRLFYMWEEGDAEPKMADRSSISTLRKRGKKGEGVLHAVWASSADNARQKIRRGEASLGAEQMPLFKAGRVLRLKAEDPATSEDRLDACLERKGWEMKRIRALQESISEKGTIDMFTGRTGKLTAGEVWLKKDIDNCLQRMKKGLAGATANCGVWQEVYSPHYGKTVARCLKYAPRCDPPGETVPLVRDKDREAALLALQEGGPMQFGPLVRKSGVKKDTLPDVIYLLEKQGFIRRTGKAPHFDYGLRAFVELPGKAKVYSKERAEVKKLLKRGPLHIDMIQSMTGWKPSKVSAVLVTMELENEARQAAGKMFYLAGAGSLSGALRTCIGYKRVKTRKNPKGVMRCSTYAATATAKACLPETMPPPEPEPEFEPKKSDVNSIARALAADANALEEESGPALAREILSRGGIAAHARGREKEEYKRLPLVLKRKTGLPMDEMASEMNLDETTLSMMIAKTYGTGKVKRRFTAKDFEAAAYGILEEEFYGPSLALAGPVMTCLEFYKSGRCKKFAPTCSPPGMPCITGPGAKAIPLWKVTRQEAEKSQQAFRELALAKIKKLATEFPDTYARYLPKKGKTLSHDIAMRFMPTPEISEAYKSLMYFAHKEAVEEAMQQGKKVSARVRRSVGLEGMPTA